MNLPVLERFTLHHKVIGDVWYFTFIVSAIVPALDQNHAKNMYKQLGLLADMVVLSHQIMVIEGLDRTNLQ
jgi:hypothetical protein